MAMLILICLSAGIIAKSGAYPMTVGPPSCSILPVTPEFFTCSQRVPGKYADDKRLCRFYWECKEDGSIEHVMCPYPRTVFDDRAKKCVVNGKPENVTCPVDYGGFRSAGSVCRGRPYARTVSQAEKVERSRSLIQAFYPNRLSDCTTFYWCVRTDMKSYGFRFDCPAGEIFDEESLTCQKSANVTCNCGNFTDVA